MVHSLRFRLAAVAAGCALALTTIGGAAAATPQPILPTALSGTGACATEWLAAKASPTVVNALRAVGDCEIERRFATLTDLGEKIAASRVMTASHRTALNAEIGSARSGLAGLKVTIDAETSARALRTEIARIATDYRVYLLVCRQVHLVNAADGALAIGARFDTVATKLAGQIAAAKAAGKDVTKAQADLAVMNAAVSQARGLATPVAATVLPLTPAEYNAGAARPLLDGARAALTQAAALLRTARSHARAVIVDLG